MARIDLFIFIVTIVFPLSILVGSHVIATARDIDKTALITDTRTGTVRILVGGREIVIIDDTGLYVRGDMAYTGTIMDGRPAHLREGRDAD